MSKRSLLNWRLSYNTSDVFTCVLHPSSLQHTLKIQMRASRSSSKQLREVNSTKSERGKQKRKKIFPNLIFSSISHVVKHIRIRVFFFAVPHLLILSLPLALLIFQLIFNEIEWEARSTAGSEFSHINLVNKIRLFRFIFSALRVREAFSREQFWDFLLLRGMWGWRKKGKKSEQNCRQRSSYSVFQLHFGCLFKMR